MWHGEEDKGHSRAVTRAQTSFGMTGAGRNLEGQARREPTPYLTPMKFRGRKHIPKCCKKWGHEKKWRVFFLASVLPARKQMRENVCNLEERSVKRERWQLWRRNTNHSGCPWGETNVSQEQSNKSPLKPWMVNPQPKSFKWTKI